MLHHWCNFIHSFLFAGTTRLSWTPRSSCKWRGKSLEATFTKKKKKWHYLGWNYLFFNQNLVSFTGPSHRRTRCMCSTGWIQKYCSKAHTWLTKRMCWCIYCCVSNRDNRGNQESQEMKETSGRRSDFKWCHKFEWTQRFYHFRSCWYMATSV